MKNTLNKSISVRRGVVAGSDILLLLFAGLLYAWSIFVKPLEDEFGWVRSQTSLTFTICVISNTLAAWRAAVLAKKITPQWVVRLAACIALAGFLCTSRTQHLWQIYLFYGLLCSAAIGMTYNVALSTIVKWFEDKAGLMTGVMLMCYGMGGMIFGSLASCLIERIGWRATFVVLGIICFVLMMLGSFQIREPRLEESQLLPQAVLLAYGTCERNYTPRDMVRIKAFWLFACWTILVATIGLTISSHASPVAQSLGVTAASAAIYAGIVSLFNGLGRVFFGITFDRFGQKKSLIFVNICAFAGTGLLCLSYFAVNRILLLPAFALLGLTFGGAPVSSASFIKSMFGNSNYGVNLGFGNLSVLLAAYIGPYISGGLYLRFGYGAVSIFLLIFAVAGLVFGCALSRVKLQ